MLKKIKKNYPTAEISFFFSIFFADFDEITNFLIVKHKKGIFKKFVHLSYFYCLNNCEINP